MILGHEVAGTVVASADPRVPEGVLVTSNSAWTCGACEYCTTGRDNLCAGRRSLGKHRWGAFADLVAIPGSAIIDVPQDMDPVRAALTEPTAVALHAVNLGARALAWPVGQARALVMGAGAIGLLAALVLGSQGCADLAVAEVQPERRAAAKRILGCRTYDPRSEPPPADAFDLVVDAVGAEATVQAGLIAARRGGVVSVTGLHSAQASIDLHRLIRRQITLVGAAYYPKVELHAAVRLLATTAFRDLSWAQVRPFADGPRAFAELAAGSPYAKIILQPDAAAGEV
jgi:alcohol dehydrogenase